MNITGSGKNLRTKHRSITGYTPDVSAPPPFVIVLARGALPSGLPAALGAYSMRAMYVSPVKCLRVQNQSTLAITDVFTDTTGTLTTDGGPTPLASFLTSSTGAVLKWYDQSVNGSDAVPVDPTNPPLLQPQTIGWKMSFNSGFSIAGITGASLSQTPYSVSVVEKRATRGFEPVFSIGNVSTPSFAGIIVRYNN